MIGFDEWSDRVKEQGFVEWNNREEQGFVEWNNREGQSL